MPKCFSFLCFAAAVALCSAAGDLNAVCGEITAVSVCGHYACLPVLELATNTSIRACGLCVTDADCNYGFDTVYNRCYLGGTPEAVCRTKGLFSPFTWRDGLTSVFIFLSGMVAAGAGIGGGGLYVPLFVIFAWGKTAVERSLAATSGLSVAMMCIVFWQEHAGAAHAYGRPLVNYRAMLVFEPIVLLGTVAGRLLYKMLPTVLVYAMLLVLLFATSIRTWMKVAKQIKKDKVAKDALKAAAEGYALENHDEEVEEAKEEAKAGEVPLSPSGKDPRPTWAVKLFGGEGAESDKPREKVERPTEQQLVTAFLARAEAASAIRTQLQLCLDTLEATGSAHDSAEFTRVKEFIRGYQLLDDSGAHDEGETKYSAIAQLCSKLWNLGGDDADADADAADVAAADAAARTDASASAVTLDFDDAADGGREAEGEGEGEGEEEEEEEEGSAATATATPAPAPAPAPAATSEGTPEKAEGGAVEIELASTAASASKSAAPQMTPLKGLDMEQLTKENMPALQIDDILVILENKWIAPTKAMPCCYPAALLCRAGVVLAQQVAPDANCVPEDGDSPKPSSAPASRRRSSTWEDASLASSRVVWLRDRPVTPYQKQEYRSSVERLMRMHNGGRNDGALDVVQFRKLVKHLTSTEWGVHDLLRRESYKPLGTIALCLVCWVGVLGLQLVIKNATTKCSAANTVLTLAFIPLLYCFTAFGGTLQYMRSTRKKKLFYSALAGDIRWNLRTALLLPIPFFFAGLLASLLGIGGGMVIGPLLLEINMDPVVAGATTAAMTLFTASSATIQFLISDSSAWDYFLWYACVAFVAGLIGRVGVSWILKKTGLVSIVIIILAVLITGAFVMTIYVAGYRIILEFIANVPLSFTSPCS